jgi:tetratricopeptide (TPR) repeat protein
MKFRYKLLTITVVASLSLSGCGLSSANRAYSNALDAYEEQDYETAKEYFIKAIKANEDKAEYHIDYGFDLLNLKEYAQAREQFEYVISDKEITMVKENNKKAYRGIGISYLMEAKYSEAITNFDQAIQIKEAKDLDTDLLFYKASALEQINDYETAAEIYTKLLELKGKDAAIYSARGNIYRLVGNYELSIADYDKAIEIAPKEFNYYLGKFASLKEFKKDEEAQAVLEQAAQLKVSGDYDKYELAKVHFYQGNYEVALNEFNAAIENGLTQAYYFLGEMNLINKDYVGALAQFDAYLSAGNLEFGLLYNQLLTCYLQTDNIEQAKVYLEKAKQANDASIQDQVTKNEIIYLEKTGDYATAYSLITAYVEKYPEDEGAKKDYYFLKTRVEEASQIGSMDDTTTEDNTTIDNTTGDNTTEDDTTGDGTTVEKP